MEKVKIKVIALLIVFITCAGFVSWNREEETRLLNNNTAIIPDKCFQNFMKNMSELGAVFYIPDNKLEKGKELGLVPKEKSANQTESYEFYSFFNQVVPVERSTDECSKKLKLSLEELQMVIFVDKKKSDQYSKYGIEKTAWKVEHKNFKLDGKYKLTEKLTVKFDNNTNAVLIPMSWSWGL